MTDDKSGRIFITNDEPKKPVGSDESARTLDTFISPPYETRGTMKGYIAAIVIAGLVAAAGYALWSHYSNAPKTPAIERRE
jgi:hypothetical protein